MKSVTDIENFSELVAAHAFANLLSAQCFEIESSDNRSYSHSYRYKTRPDINRDMVSSREEAVLDAAAEMQFLSCIIQQAGTRIRANAPETDRPVEKSDCSILNSIRKIVDDALLFDPPVSLCSV